MHGFDRATALSPSGEEGVFTGTLDRDWWGGVGPHGGYLAAILMRGLALADGSEGRHRPRSLTIHYARSPAEGAFELHTRVERKGQALSTVSLRLVQKGEAAVLALGAVARDRQGPELAETRMPETPPWREVEPTEFPPELSLPFARQLEHRHCIGPEPLSGGERALGGGWIRLREPRALDDTGAALFMDSWWPAVWGRMRDVPRAPTIDLTLHLRGDLSPTEEPVLASFSTRLVRGGFMDEEGELWSADGRLLVQSRQMALLLVPPGAL